MSSLRLALKQSLQESGGGTFSSGHGDKKKRKKKKNSNSNNNNLASSSGKKGVSSKRKRGRPRKHPRRDNDDNEDDNEDLRRKQQQHPSSKPELDDDQDEDDFYSENEFSYNDDDYNSGEEDDDESDDEDDETEDGSPYRSRSRAPLDDEEGELDDGMHSEEDEMPKSGVVSTTTKSNDTEKPASETKESNSLVTGETHAQLEEPATMTTANSGGASSSSEPKSSSQVPSSNAEEEEMIRKKLKLLKLKKKLEKNQSQNSAATKIQNHWKKSKNNNTSSPESKVQEDDPSSVTTTSTSTTIAVATTAAATSTTSVDKDKTKDSKGHVDSKSQKVEAETSAPSKAPSPTSDLQQQQQQQQQKITEGKGNKKSVDSAKNESTKSDLPSDPVSVKPSTSTTASGDNKASKKADGGGEEDEAPPTTTSSSKKHGYVKAPTREVKQWAANMKDKKCRKYVRIGMRVKVRFAIPVKRDGISMTKKKFFGGKVAAISKNRTKIRIKYDDGTSEVSDFPDGDVYIDAVDNGEHAVPADKFIPPTLEEELEQQLETEEAAAVAATTTAAAAAPKEEQEEGEIPTIKAVAAVMETEEGEVEEETKPKARDVETLDASKKTAPGKASDENSLLAKAIEKPMDVPTTPPSNSLSASAALAKNEKTNAEESTKDDVQMKPAAPSPSQEEGELSPGITVLKTGENASDEQTAAPLAKAAESKPLPPQALLPSNIESDKVTSEPIKFAAETPSQATVVDAATDADNSSDKSKIPAKPKKLSIRIPSLATIKSMASPKSSGAKSPLHPPSVSKDAEISKVNDVLEDTPETKKEVAVTTKRKRVSDDDATAAAAAPSLDEAVAHEPPAKRRIKVAIGKNLLDAAAAAAAAKSESNEASAPNALEMGVAEEQELAPITEEPISAGEIKKKKKRADRAKSPRPKSPLPVPEPDKINSKTNSNSSEAAPEATPKQQKIGSKGSAIFLKKVTKEDAPETKQAKAAEAMSAKLLNATISLRTGRKAAEEAKEKLSVKQKAKLSAKEPKEKEAAPLESSKKKKKRRRDKEEEENVEEPEEIEVSELEWVQCDSCKKWRALPDNVKISSLPDLWYCQMNVYDPKRNNCEAPEQNVKQLLRERKKKARKRQRREAELAESQQEKPTKKSKQQDDEIAAVTVSKKKTKQEKLQAGASTPRSVSPKPTKSVKSGKAKESAAESKKALAEAKRANLEGGKKSKGVVEDSQIPTDSGSDTQKEVKKKGKKGKKESQDSSDNQDVDDTKKGGRKRGRPSRNQNACTPVPDPKNGGVDEDNVEWVQCDKCEKWRKLPPHISADELPDVWNCTMNTWNPSAASCDADEDKADAHHQEVGAAEWQLRQAHAGKYSYRQMIFGTGARKHNRPMSERSRAAESLFIQPVTSDDQPYPTTQYTKSSAFLPRLTNFDKRNAVEENTIGIFDVLRHSSLWEELRAMDMRPAKVLSSSTSGLNIPGQKLKTYDGLSDEIKHAMQDIVLQTLEFGCLTGDEITGKAQWFPYKTSIKGVAGIRGYCNEDIIIHTLLDLVRDGLVEMATVRDPFRPVSQWIPRYRRVGTRRAFEAVEAIKASRCMKISKPWKQRPSNSTTTTEWVTGQNVT